MPDGVHFIRADGTPPGAYDVVTGEFDQVVELAYAPALLQGAFQALAPRAAQWTLISSISAYTPPWRAGGTEYDPLVAVQDLNQYPDVKDAAELSSTQALGKRLRIVRPGLIARLGDGSDRLDYWMNRMAVDGPILWSPRVFPAWCSSLTSESWQAP